MNLTRLGELLDRAENATLTPSEALELAIEQSLLQAATAWTSDAPRRPGLYAWRAGPDTVAIVVRVIDRPTGTSAACEPGAGGRRDVADMGGVWSGPIVLPREEAR